MISVMIKHFFSYPFILILLIVLGAGAGVATFLESMYDTQTAKLLVYQAWWYELVMIALTLSMIGLMYQRRMWVKMGAFIVHVAFVAILIGAGLTRYFGYEGIIHIREGLSEYEMASVQSYLQVSTPKAHFEYPLIMGKMGNAHFSYKEFINDKPLILSYKSFVSGGKENLDVLTLDVTFDGKTKSVRVEGGAGWVEAPISLSFDGLELEISWGSKLVALPFELKLNDFQLERYAGSQSPSSYASEIEVIDKARNVTMPYRIFMNHPLTYNGFTFFQSSYDKDEKGTILEVNKDPGKWPTYVGYFLLCVGFVTNFFTHKSRFKQLYTFLNTAKYVLFFMVCLGLSESAYADQTAYLEQFKQNSASHANGIFSELLVQDYNGRIKPMSTEAIEILTKISGESSLYGLSAEQVILGMTTNPLLWQQMKLIKLTNERIKETLNLPKEVSYVSFSEMFTEEGSYKLAKDVGTANQKSQKRRTTYDNDVIKFDEKLNIAYLTFKGVLFKFVPLPNDPNNAWIDPNSAFSHPMVSKETKALIGEYFSGLQEGVQKNEWQKADNALVKLQAHQHAMSADVAPTPLRVKAEVLYNHLGLFQKLFGLYFVVGGCAFVLALVSLFANTSYKKLEKGVLILFIIGFIVHTLALALRWYVAGHAPWSNSYESMVYIGWSAALAGIVVFRHAILSLSAAAILAAVVMLVAHMSFMNPQITNLVPVLKSYWLSIHVSVITASYGFLGMGAVLGGMTLMLMALKNAHNRERINANIRYLSAINEISLIIGLSMLTIGNFFGGIWANESWGRYWGWDPKETWSFVSIVVYALILHIRFVPKIYSIFLFSIASLVGYSSILMTYFGVNFYLTGMHSYAASGEQTAVPSFIYYVIGGVVALCAVAYRGRDVKTV